MLKTIRILLVLLAAYEDWEVHHMDVKTAFLNPMLKEEVYMVQPKGFEHAHENYACLLRKALYGLKQALREWYTEINGYLKSIGFMNSTADPNLYLAPDIILILFVDDMLILAKSIISLRELKQCLTQTYDMADLGE